MKLILFAVFLTFSPLALSAPDCLTQKQLESSYQILKAKPSISKNELSSFFQKYEDSIQRCPRLEKSYLKVMKASDFSQVKFDLVSKWYENYGGDIGPLESDLSYQDTAFEKKLQEFQLAPETRARIQKQREAIHQKNNKAMEELRAQPPSACTPVDLRSQLPPLKFQGGTGLCASFVTSDLLSLEFKQPVSPLSLAIGLGKYDRRGNKTVGERPDDGDVSANAARGGILWEPLKVAAADVGYCYEKDFPSNWDDVIQVSDTSDVLSSVRELGWGFLPKTPQSCNQTTANLRRLFPSAGPEDLQEIYKSSQGNLLLKKFDQCRRQMPKEILTKYKHVEFKVGSDQELKKKVLDSALDRGEMIASEISSHLLSDAQKASKRPNHAIGVVGRRENPETGACEYLVRDSLGKEKLDSSYTVASKGHTWIPEKVLLQSLRQMIYKKP